MSRMSAPPSEKNFTCWFICIPCSFSSSKSRRLGFLSYVWTNPKRRSGTSSDIDLPTMTSKFFFLSSHSRT